MGVHSACVESRQDNIIFHWIFFDRFMQLHRPYGFPFLFLRKVYNNKKLHTTYAAWSEKSIEKTYAAVSADAFSLTRWVQR